MIKGAYDADKQYSFAIIIAPVRWFNVKTGICANKCVNTPSTTLMRGLPHAHSYMFPLQYIEKLGFL